MRTILFAILAGMLSLPAGFIPGGGLAIAGAVLSMMGEDEEK